MASEPVGIGGSDADRAANGNLDRALVFSGTGWYRHPEIPISNGWLIRLGAEHGIRVDVTETPNDITAERLSQYQVLVLNNANSLDKVLNEAQRDAIRQWYEHGGGIVGLHAALVHQEAWPWFMDLAGCDFNSDSDFVRARVVVDPAASDEAMVRGQGAQFWYTADWHNHTKSVSGLPGVRVLLRLDESTFEPVRDYFKAHDGKPMGPDHPMTWTREFDGGRFFYTELGHDVRSLDTPFGRQLVLGALRWTAGEKKK
jgi:type 1 glutamine amidotransferase